MYCDAHTHLNNEKLVTDWSSYVDRFVDVWWRILVNVWVNDAYNRAGVEIAQACHDRTDVVVKATVGLHPCEVAFGDMTRENVDQSRAQLQDLYGANRENIVAIGEAWVDLHHEGTQETLLLQQRVFARQCAWATELDIPLVIHSRSAWSQTREVLQDYPDMTVYLHCWGYDEGQVEMLASRDSSWYIWFCGNISYRKAEEIRRSFGWLWHHDALDHVVLETDAPYLSPQNKRWTTNEPANVKDIYDYVSETFVIDHGMLTQRLYDNVCRLYWLG